MAKESAHLSEIILNVSGLGSPTKRHRFAEWIRNSTQLYAVYRTLTLDLKTHMSWKWKDGKRYSVQVGTKREQGDFRSKTVKKRQHRVLYIHTYICSYIIVKIIKGSI